jgi:DeoR family transcriptional regulator of aga operon/DeoR family fructose operon transcriptional repressor
VIQIGGELRKNTISCVGSYTEEMIRRFTFDTAFIGINGLDEKGRLYCGSIQETGIYHAIMASSRRVIVLADSTKIGKQDFAQFGTIDQINLLITDSHINPAIKVVLEKLNLKIVVG